MRRIVGSLFCSANCSWIFWHDLRPSCSAAVLCKPGYIVGGGGWASWLEIARWVGSNTGHLDISGSTRTEASACLISCIFLAFLFWHHHESRYKTKMAMNKQVTISIRLKLPLVSDVRLMRPRFVWFWFFKLASSIARWDEADPLIAGLAVVVRHQMRGSIKILKLFLCQWY